MALHKKLTQNLFGALTEVKTYHLHILSFAMIVLLIVIVYWRDLQILANEALNAEVFSHIFLLPFFIGYLLYRKKDLVRASEALEAFQRRSKAKYWDGLVGLSLCLLALLFYWYGSYTFYPLEYHMLSLPIFVAGIVLIFFNLKTFKTLFIPILFLLFLVPLPNEIMYTLGGTLANFNAQVSHVLLKAFGLPVTLSQSYGAPTLKLETSAVPFAIDLPCSGIYTLIAFAMFAAFLAVIVSASVWKKFGIFAFGFLIFDVLNIFRITLIISAAFFLGEEIAMQIFHTAAGLILIFVGMMLTLFASEKILKINFTSKISEMPLCPKCRTFKENFCLNCGKFFNPIRRKPSQTFLAKLILLLLGCSVITLSINAPTFAIAQETLEVASAWENTTNILPQIPQYDLRFLERDKYYEQLAKQDASLTYVYIPFNITTPVVYVLIGVADSISNLHNWEVCLITWQTAQGRYPLVSVLDSRDVQLIDGTPPIIARYLVFQNPEQNYTQVTLYWYTKATFKTGITVQQKYVRISLIILTRNPAKYQGYESLLLDLGKVIASHWEPIKSQSLISLGVPAQQTLLILSIAFIIITKTTQRAAEWRKRTNNLKIFNNLASPTEKLVLQTVTELSGERKAATTRDINLAIKRKAGRFLKLERLVEVLNRLEEYGFIKRDIASKDNRPFLVWKS